MNKTTPTYTKRQFVASQLAAIIFDMFAAIGLCLVGYGVIAAYSGKSWNILDDAIRWIGPVVTIIATIITSCSIYLPVNRVPPKIVTRIFTAPCVLLMCLAALFYMFVSESVLPETVLQGFAILGLSGGLMRLVPRIHDLSYPSDSDTPS